MNWRSSSYCKVSDDGRWLAYSVDGAHRELVVRSIQGTREFRYQLSNSSRAVSGKPFDLSADGRWIAFVSSGDQVPDAVSRLELIDLSTGSKLGMGEVDSFGFAGETWLAVLNKSGLELYSLTNPSKVFVAHANAYSFNAKSDRLAVVQPGELAIYSLLGGKPQLLAAVHGGAFAGLTWSQRGYSLAALEQEAGEIAVLTLSALDTSTPRIDHWNTSTPGFPVGFSFAQEYLGESEDGEGHYFVWRDDEDGIFFGLNAKPPRDAEKNFLVSCFGIRPTRTCRSIRKTQRFA